MLITQECVQCFTLLQTAPNHHSTQLLPLNIIHGALLPAPRVFNTKERQLLELLRFEPWFRQLRVTPKPFLHVWQLAFKTHHVCEI